MALLLGIILIVLGILLSKYSNKKWKEEGENSDQWNYRYRRRGWILGIVLIIWGFYSCLSFFIEKMAK
jgi:hypothetical protein